MVVLHLSRGTSPPSRMVASQPSQGTSQPSHVEASQPFRGMSQRSQVTSQEPSQVTTSKQRSQRTSQFTRVTVPQLTRMTLPEATRVIVPEATHVTVPEPTRVSVPQPCQGMALQPLQGTSKLSHVVVPQSSRGISQLSRVMPLQPSRGTLQPDRVVAPQPYLGMSQPASVVATMPSRGKSQPSRVSASLAPPPAPPAPTPTAPAHRRLQQRCSPVRGGISSPDNDQFLRPRVKLAAELTGGAEGSRGTAMPLPPIRPPAAAAPDPTTIHEQPKKQVVPTKSAPPPRERKVNWAPQVGTGPLPNSRLCTSKQLQPQPQPPQQPRKSSPTCNRGRSIRNPGKAARPEPEAAVPKTKYKIKLSADATWLLLRRHRKEWGWMNHFINSGLLQGSQSVAGMDLTTYIKILLLNNQNRYDNEEYEEDPAPGVVDQELVCRCMEWLRGAEKAKQEDRLGTLPHLYDH
ncbi:vesicle transport protein SFT2A isoform X1 [Pelodiscus sinensis]|uniref:vesicle transport protein SFT2A isoform X1 n=1 Tax=Pelodiscus sinensis TaxID=13735 RepID=UPI003F6AD418